MIPTPPIDPRLIESTLSKAHRRRFWRRCRLTLFSLMTLASLVFTVSLLLREKVSLELAIAPAAFLQLLALVALRALWAGELRSATATEYAHPVFSRLCSQQRSLEKTVIWRRRWRLIIGLATPPLFVLAVAVLGSERIDSDGAWGLGISLSLAFLLAMAGMSWEIEKLTQEIRQLASMREEFTDGGVQ